LSRRSCPLHPPYLLTLLFFFFNDTSTTELHTLSLHDALPISTAASISASFKIIVGELEPSSILSFFSPAFFAMLSPVSSPPVNDTILILGCVINVSPISLPLPVITDRILS